MGSTLEELNNLFKEHPKAFIIGTYNAGKTSIVQKLAGTAIEISPDVIDNTKGEVIYHVPLNSNKQQRQVLLVDTEGMFQPIEGAHPGIIREILIEQTIASADHIVFVLDLIHEHEFQLLQKLITKFVTSPRQSSLTIVHNRKDIATMEQLHRYRDEKIKPLFQDKQQHRQHHQQTAANFLLR